MSTARQNHQNSSVSCLIVGNMGFVGLDLAKQLLSQNCRVISIDQDNSHNLIYIEELKENPLFKHFTNNNKLEEIFVNGIDYVFHLQNLDSFENFNKLTNLQDAYRASAVETYLNFSQKAGAKFLFAGIESIYEDESAILAAVGKDVPDRSIFWQVLRDSETMVANYIKETGLNACMVRIADPYGKGISISSSGVLAHLIKSAINNGSILLPNDGMENLYLTHRSDIAFGMIKAIFSQSSKGKLYALVNKEGQSMLSLAYGIQKLMDNPIEIKFIPSDKYHERTISQAMIGSQEALGWFPRFDKDLALKETVKWFSQYIMPIYQKPIQFSYSAPKQTEIDPTSVILAKFPPFQEETFFTKPYQEKPITQTEAQAIQKPDKVKKTLPPITIQPPVVHFSFLSIIKSVLLKFNLKIGSGILTISIIGVVVSIILIALPQLVYELGTKTLVKNDQERLKLLLLSRPMSPDDNKTAFFKVVTPIVQPWVYWQRELFNSEVSSIPKESYSDNLEKIAKEMNSVYQNTEKILDIALGRGSGELTQLWENNKRNLSSVLEELAFIEAKNKKTGEKEFDLAQIQELKNIVSQWQQTMIIFPQLMAFNGRKVVVLGLQDSLELRPGGGFLDSIVFLTLDKGKILDIQTKNVYELDSAMKGTKKAPEEIASIIELRLGESQWWLRDVNMFADFPGKTAPRVAWFLNKQTGQTIDGVWMVDSYFIKNMIQVTGEVFLPEFNETITENNFMERLYTHATLSLGDNQQNQQSFMQILSLRLWEKIKAKSSTELLSLLPFLSSQATQKHFMAFMDGVSGQSGVWQNWQGNIKLTPRQVLEFGNLGVTDFVYPVEANLGINKANYFIDKNLDYEINISDQSTAEVKLNYNLKNNSQTETWPSGSYKTQIWLYIPESAKLKKVGVKSEGALLELNDEDISLNTEGDKQSISFYLEIPPQSQQNIEITYNLPSDFENSNSYGLYIQKQPGIDYLPFKLKLNYPVNWKIQKLSQEVNRQSGLITFENISNKDFFFAVSFSR